MTLVSGRFGWIWGLGAVAALAACGSNVEESAATGGLGGAAVGAAAGGPVGAVAGAGAAAGSGVEIGQQQGQLPAEPGDTAKPDWRASQTPPANATESRDMNALPPRWEQR